jgi:cyclopropane-fatty-acyl-phospholipid synthase
MTSSIDLPIDPILPAVPVPRGQPGLAQRFARRAVLSRMNGLAGGAIEFIEGGTRTRIGSGAQPVRLTVHDPATWVEVATGGTVGAGAAYIAGMWTCDDLVALVRLLVRNRQALVALEGGLARLLAPLRSAWHWSRRNTRAGSRANIAAHYDLGNEFFALWLDPTMTYSSAVFASPDEVLERAQEGKIDGLCRALGLGSGDHLLEIGTGWGALAIHAARTYGCRVTTATLSRRQQETARARVRAAGLESRIEVVLQDYRDLRGSYDKLVSVEMIEAVGHRHYPDYFAACARLLKADGVMAMQAITIAECNYAAALKEVDFIQRYVFPGCCIPSLGALTGAMGRASDLDLVSVEDITPHYARTLARWRGNFHAKIAEVRALGFDDDFIRLWDFYLAYCEGGFSERAIGCRQLLIAKSGWRPTASCAGTI